jgi:hypothetical protein
MKLPANRKFENDRPGLSPRHFLVFYLCSRVGPVPYNPARHPAFIKAPRLLGSIPFYLLVLGVATANPHLHLSASLFYSPRTTGSTLPVLEVYAILSVLLASWEMPAEAEAPTWAEFLAVRLFSFRVRGTRSSFSLHVEA